MEREVDAASLRIFSHVVIAMKKPRLSLVGPQIMAVSKNVMKKMAFANVEPDMCSITVGGSNMWLFGSTEAAIYKYFTEWLLWEIEATRPLHVQS